VGLRKQPLEELDRLSRKLPVLLCRRLGLEKLGDAVV
jgi:hypothetical protein